MKIKLRKNIYFTVAFMVILNHSVNAQGSLFSWGNNINGKLGDGSTSNRSNPSKIANIDNWVSVTGGLTHTVALNVFGELWVWGANSWGQLGDSTTNQSLTPKRIGYSQNWVKIAAGYEHTLAINSNGELYAWGRNHSGQLGNGTRDHLYFPTRIGNASNWVDISGGYFHSLAINSDGELYSWGSNGSGQLGDGNSGASYRILTPTQVGIAANWIISNCGQSFSFAINTNGELYGWGDNVVGQLGDSSTINSNTPKRIGNSNKWVRVEAENHHVLAINSDGELFSWGRNSYGQLGDGTTTNSIIAKRIGNSKKWVAIDAGYDYSLAIDENGKLYAWGKNDYGQLGDGSSINKTTPTQIGLLSTWLFISTNYTSSFGGQSMQWIGSGNINTTSNWSRGTIPNSTDSTIIKSGTLTVNQSTTLDIMTVLGGSTVKLEAPLTLRNLHLKNGTIDLNGHRLTITGGIYQSTDSTNYYIQAGTSASPKPLSELVFAPTANTSSTLYFNPNANTLKVLELGTASKTATATLGNAVKIKGGKTPSNVGSLKVNNGSKLIIPNGASLTLACDTFNSHLSLSHPAQRVIHCTGTGTFNIERQHYGARGWRIYSHPFSSDINLTQIADDIELIGSGGTAEGFYSDAYTNNSTFWYDYSKADTTAATDPSWTGFNSANGTLLSGNPNKWKKHSPIIVFNPGAVRGSGAFSNPTAATYQQGKITLSYVLDSNAVHLNDGKTQTISTAVLSTSPKSRYFFITNPFTAPIRLGRIQGLNLTNCANKFYYWKQNQASISSNFMPAAWASEALFNGNATRDSNISIPAFGTILIEMKNSSLATTFTIPEGAKQLTNFNYLVGGDLTSSGSGVKQTLFLEIPQTYQGPGAIEVQLLMNDSVPVDRMLIYDRMGESPSFTNNDAKKFKEPSFANIYSLARGGELLSLDAQDITARLQSGEPSVEIPLVIERDFNKSQKNLRLRIWEKHSDLMCYFRDAKTGQKYPAASFDDLPIAFEADETLINRYSLVFKRNSSSTEDLTEKPNLAQRAPMELIVYPNPVEDKLYLEVINASGEIPFNIYSITGVKVLEGSIKSEKTINTAYLNAGVYVIDAGGVKVKFIKK